MGGGRWVVAKGFRLWALGFRICLLGPWRPRPKAQSPKPVTACLLSCLALLASWLSAADSVTLSNGTTTAGDIVRLNADGVLLLQPEGRPQMIPEAQIKGLNLDLPTGGRPAQILQTDGKSILIMATAWQEGTLHGVDTDGKPHSVKPAELKEARLYPVVGLRLKLPVEFVKQKPDYCGEACLEMATAYLGQRVAQDQVNEAARLQGRRGMYGSELEQVLASLKLAAEGIHGFANKSAEDQLLDRMRLLRALERRRPVLLGVWFDPQNKKNEGAWNFDHFVLLTGYDLEKEQFLVHDPGREAYHATSFQAFTEQRRNAAGGAYSVEFKLARKPASPASVEGENSNPLVIRPVDKEKWGCQTEDVRKVLYSAAGELWRHFPERKVPPIEVSPKGGPITLFQRGPNGEIRVRLNSGDLLWAQISFQFAHEFCHILCNYREGNERNKWLEESICETAALFALRRISETWQTKPPYPNWKDYARHLRSYADERIAQAKLPEGKTLAQWYEENAEALAKEACDRARNNIVAAVLLKLFEEAPGAWAAVEYLNSEPAGKPLAFKEHLQAWQRHCPEKHKEFVGKIARELGIELGKQ